MVATRSEADHTPGGSASARGAAAAPPLESPSLTSAKELPAFRRKLLAWYRSAKRDLDWRRTRDPYRIWLSEIMLQQTRVAAVIPYYRRFLARFPTLAS